MLYVNYRSIKIILKAILKNQIAQTEAAHASAIQYVKKNYDFDDKFTCRG